MNEQILIRCSSLKKVRKLLKHLEQTTSLKWVTGHRPTDHTFIDVSPAARYDQYEEIWIFISTWHPGGEPRLEWCTESGAGIRESLHNYADEYKILTYEEFMAPKSISIDVEPQNLGNFLRG